MLPLKARFTLGELLAYKYEMPSRNCSARSLPQETVPEKQSLTLPPHALPYVTLQSVTAKYGASKEFGRSGTAGDGVPLGTRSRDRSSRAGRRRQGAAVDRFDHSNRAASPRSQAVRAA